MTPPDGPIWTWDAVQVAAAVRARAVSPTEVLAAVVERIDAVEPGIRAFCTPMLDEAGRAATALEARLARGEAVGALAGVPVAVKDLISTKGTRTTSGSVAYRDFVPDEDDIAVERLRAADALIIGKTNASEFGYGASGSNRLFPRTRNPWDPTRTPGGSSAGSAAAVASGMVPAALGSDGGGSIRIPASLCGIYGIKASMGRVPLYPGCRDDRYPGVSSWESIEHIGPLTRTVADSALMMSVLAGPDPRDRHSIPSGDVDWLAARLPPGRPLQVGYCPGLGGAVVDDGVLRAVEAALERLGSGHGLEIRRIELDWPSSSEVLQATIAMDTDLVGVRRMIAAHPGEMSANLVRIAEREWLGEDFTDAIRERKALVNRMWRLMAGLDVLLTPTLAVTAFDLDLDAPGSIAGRPAAADGWTPFTGIANLTGQPAASVPIGFADGLPVGLQIIGRHLADGTVLAVSAIVERALALDRAFPPLG